MSALSDIVSKLAAPAAEAVTRAAAEFGDDAVRSILKATPDMRKRLAELAEKRVASSATAFNKKLAGRANRKNTSYINDAATALKMDNMHALQRRLHKLPTSKDTRSLVEEVVIAPPWNANNQIGRLMDFSYDATTDPALVLDSMEKINKPLWNKAVVDIATSGDDSALRSFMTDPTGAKKILQPIIDAIRNAGVSVSPYSTGTVFENIPNMPGLISQTNLSALLRMIGDAQ